MKEKVLFIALSALCVFATATLLQNYLPGYQYATVSLSEGTPITHVTSDAVTSTPTLFPLAPVKKATTTTGTKAPATGKPAVTTTTTQASTPVLSSTDVEALNASVRDAVVNIVCQSRNSESPISASGVIIDPRGVVLTNAHVGQYLLLRDSGNIALTCNVRTGSPADISWNVRVLYVSSQWIHAHADEIREEHATGTGENDYALLQITGRVNGDALPASFPYVTPNIESATSGPGEQVLVASYPAGFLGGVITLTDLNLISTITTIKEVFTYATGTHDVVSLGGIIVAQSGSSGGAVVDLAKRLIAIIATSSTGDETSSRDLRGITLYHIDQSLRTETGKGISGYLAGNLDTVANSFTINTEPGLIKALIDGLLKK